MIDVFARGGDGALWEKTTTDGGGSGPPGPLSAGRSLPAQDQRPAHRARSSRRLRNRRRRRPLVEVLERLVVVGVPIPRREADLWTRRDLTECWRDRRLCARRRRRPLGEDHHEWRRPWSAWTSLGGTLAPGTGPAACSSGSGRLDVFVTGAGGALWWKTYSGSSWSAYQSLGGVLTSGPAATSPTAGAIDVFARGGGGALWEKSIPAAVGPAGHPSAACPRPQTPTIFYVPQAGSTWANQGTAGASYNAYVSTPSLFQTQSNGYPYWGDIVKNDSFVYIPAGSATNNQNVASWEIGFHFSGMTGQRFQKIWDKACGAFMIEIDTSLGANQCCLLSIALRLVAPPTHGGTYQLIPCSAQATIITFKFRGTPVRARDMNRIRLSGSVRTETRPCIRRTLTRAAAHLTGLGRGTTIR